MEMFQFAIVLAGKLVGERGMLFVWSVFFGPAGSGGHELFIVIECTFCDRVKTAAGGECDYREHRVYGSVSN